MGAEERQALALVDARPAQNDVAHRVREDTVVGTLVRRRPCVIVVLQAEVARSTRDGVDDRVVRVVAHVARHGLERVPVGDAEKEGVLGFAIDTEPVQKYAMIGHRGTHRG